jgi:hypothetical protein
MSAGVQSVASGLADGGTGRMGIMRQTLGIAWIGAVLLLLSGCASGPFLDNPALILPSASAPVENPVFVPLGPNSYGQVFERAIDVIADYFEISEYNRYDGRIETFPRVAPGLEQPWKAGSPDFGERLYATLQTVRHRATLLIHPADNGGFFIQVTVHKELEDLFRPIRATAGAAIFNSNPTVDRVGEVIDAGRFEGNWIPIGRDIPLEQAILQKLKCSM